MLRPGGRVIVVRHAPGARGLQRLVGRRDPDEAYGQAGGATAALDASGYAGVRVLAEREGVRFVEAPSARESARAGEWRPPSIATVSPVIQPALSDARNAIRSAISSACPGAPQRMRLLRSLQKRRIVLFGHSAAAMQV